VGSQLKQNGFFCVVRKWNGFKNQFWIKVGELKIGFQSNGIEVLNGENINIYAKKKKENILHKLDLR